MECIQHGEKSFLKFRKLTESGIFHFSSTRKGWGGNGQSRFTGDPPERYQSYRQELANAFQFDPAQLVIPRQVHGTRVAVVNELTVAADLDETDALITNQPHCCVCVQTADCVPILLYDPVQQVVGTIHAGWRGTVGKIASKTVYEMQRHFNTMSEDLIAGIGPSIHLHAYEVGEDVIRAVRERLPNYRKLLKPSTSKGKAYFDLWEANKSLLMTAGVPEEQIELMGFCSFSHQSLFYSARRDGTDTGRMISGIMLAK
ncbi:peptidoglycan editing factor PgeF [Sunxiuqinia sp. sy24]|uniref:peptidoglycan editing factor PgeF n=1 Tax=Sunxiuqinia sp. sy24 TaxID=3461495 RepID=UPI00404609BF